MHNRSKPTKKAQASNAIAKTATDICLTNTTPNFHVPTQRKSAHAHLDPRHRERHSLKSAMSYVLAETVKAIIDAREQEAAQKHAKEAREARRYDEKLDQLIDAVTDLRNHVRRAKMNVRDLKDDLRLVDARLTHDFAGLNRRVTDLESEDLAKGKGRSRMEDDASRERTSTSRHSKE